LIKGKYVVKSGDEILAEKENTITNNGVTAINSYLVNSIADWAGSIGYGAINTNATGATTTMLQYELGRALVSSKTYLSSASQLVIKASIDNTFSGSIYELGVFPTNYIDGNKDAYVLYNFDEVISAAVGASSAWLQGSVHYEGNSPAVSSSYSRASASSIQINTSSVLSIFNSSKDLSDYTNSDYLHLLYYVTASLTTASNSPSVTFTFYDSASQTWSSNSASLDFSSSGYKTATISMAPWTQYWNGVAVSMSSSFVNTSTSSNKLVIFDALRFREGFTNKPIENMLVSRSISSPTTTPFFTTTYGQPIQIEYYLTVS
jgi:hypothetical protein